LQLHFSLPTHSIIKPARSSGSRCPDQTPDKRSPSMSVKQKIGTLKQKIGTDPSVASLPPRVEALAARLQELGLPTSLAEIP
jgi:hypothetical protein